ncbi:MAG: hypothetical protein AVDCRST_MAG86-941 [uncultured Truepera sp.]|uniref:Uncharacterized protein n=1 Tax=uncultured Truepera sp. TaxID=543023 RepID=A0A6J4UXZ8_9DEIN|nr:MAG: hypothetical protein AVDCRST_MAG86-941 [uncultured Truepera sp.]
MLAYLGNSAKPSPRLEPKNLSGPLYEGLIKTMWLNLRFA